MDHSSHRLSHRDHANHRHHQHQDHSPPKSLPHNTLSPVTAQFGDSSIHKHHVPRESSTFLPHSSLHQLHNNHNHHHGDGHDLHRHQHDNDLELTTANNRHHNGDDLDPHRHHLSDDHGSIDMHGGHMDHCSEGMGHMTGQVGSVFQWTKDAYVLFEQWKTSSILEVTLAMVVAALLAALYELIRNYLSNWDNAHAALHKMPTWRRVGLRVYRSFMHALTAAIGYVQMLFAMTYDLRIFVAIILGSGVGFFILGPFFRRLRDARRQRRLRKATGRYRVTGDRSGCEEEQQFIEDHCHNSGDAPSDADKGRQRNPEDAGEGYFEGPHALSENVRERNQKNADGSTGNRNEEVEPIPVDPRMSVIVLQQSALDELYGMRDTVV